MPSPAQTSIPRVRSSAQIVFWKRLALACLVTLLALALIGALGDLRAYGSRLAGTEYLNLWPVLLLAPMWQILRAYRISAFLSAKPRLLDRQLYRISAVHMLLVSILPVRSGEAALPLLLKSELGVSLPRAIGTLLAVRLYDLLTLLIIASTALLSLAPIYDFAARLFLPTLATLIGAGLFLFAAPFLAQSGDRLLTIWDPDGRRRWIVSLRQMLEVVSAMRRSSLLVRVIAASFVIWGAVFASFYFSLAAVAPDSDFRVAVVAGTASSLAVAQPINGVSGLGVVQLAWAGPANALGLSWDAAIASGIVHHLVQVLAAVLNAAIALLIYQRSGGVAIGIPRWARRRNVEKTDDTTERPAG